MSGYVTNVSAQSGAEVSIKNAHGNVKLNAAALSKFTGKYPSATTAQVKVSTLNFKTINASPESFNGVSKPFSTDSFSLTNGAVSR